jgi:hypothetical protein
MKPRTVYEKAVQDFTQTARLQATLNQHFQQASFAEFELLMGLDDEVLKRYGLPRPILERALIEVYRTVVLNQEKSRPLDHDVDANEWRWCPGGYNHRPVVERLAPGSDPLADLVVYQQTLKLGQHTPGCLLAV